MVSADESACDVAAEDFCRQVAVFYLPVVVFVSLVSADGPTKKDMAGAQF